MNKKFNFKLYIEGLKQLKMIGIMSTVILCAFSALIPIGQIISSICIDENGHKFFQKIVVSMSTITCMNQAIFFVIVPVMCLSLFNFLTKRNSCDFYHSVPVKRGSLFLSFFASIMTWIVIMLTASSLLGLIIVGIAPNLSIVIPGIFIYYIQILVTSLLVAGGFLIAISLTGTTFTNFIIAMIVLFFPRIFIMATSSIIQGMVPYIRMSSNGLLVNYNNNLLISSIVKIIISGEADSVWIPIIYTLVLGIIYTVAAYFIFKKRKSEAAGNAAITHVLQLVFRLIASFTVCLVPCSLICSVIAGERSLSGSNLFWIIAMFVFSVIVYFLYELITTRKLKNLLKAIPELGILVIINVVFILGITGYSAILKNTLPNAGSISYFNIDTQDDVYYMDGSSTNSYFSKLSSEIRITDPEAINMVAELLKTTADDYSKTHNLSNYGNHSLIDVKIKSKNSPLRRNFTISVSNDDYEKLIDYLNRNEDYIKLYTKLPEHPAAINIANDLTDEASREIYKSACDEISRMDFRNAYNYINDFSPYSGNDYLNATVTVGINQYNICILLSPELPETYALFASRMNKDKDCEYLNNLMSDWKTYSYTGSHDLSDVEYISEGFDIYMNGPDGPDFNQISANIWINGDSYSGELEISEINEDTVKLLSELANYVKPVDENTDLSKGRLISISYSLYYELTSTTRESTKNYTGYYIVYDKGVDIINKLAGADTETTAE